MVSMTVFARVSTVGVHSDLHGQSCDLKYRLFEESQDNNFSSCRDITVTCFQGRKEK